jgi:preprotein translocase subunit SecY
MAAGVPAATTNPIAVGAATSRAGIGAAVWVILVASILERLVPNELLGRVYSASRFMSRGVGPLGAVLAGVMFTAAAVLTTVLLVLFFTLMPRQVLEESGT